MTVAEQRRRTRKESKAETVYAIGHSTRSIEAFLDILRAHSVDLLVDIRTIPKSRHNPQFNSDSLKISLKEAGMEYVHLKDLGGLRQPLRDSPNTGWRNESFRGFADYMLTEGFAKGLDELVRLGGERNVAIMCAEGNPYRCHRSLVADALTARGIRTIHISSKKSGRLHALTPFAKVDGSRIAYPLGKEEGRRRETHSRQGS
ncbi:MAG: DUF488 domain-containing protein [Nitrososphaerota archaeon]|nr:DUF488 domain-containing protein [Nitrososphaerota archaeon]